MYLFVYLCIYLFIFFLCLYLQLLQLEVVISLLIYNTVCGMCEKLMKCVYLYLTIYTVLDSFYRAYKIIY